MKNSAFILFLIVCLRSIAQHPVPAVDSNLINYSIHSSDSISNLTNIAPDTLPDNIQNYDPATQNYQVWATQGNIGKAANNLIPRFSPTPGFHTGINSFDLYRYNPDQIKLYHHYYPFTDVRYVMGGKKEQVFSIIHSQNLGKLITATANLRIINSPGSYLHQKSDISNLVFSGQYHSRNEKYHLDLSLCQNILKLQENGGIVKDSVFEFNTEPDRQVIPVNLSHAQNRIRETSAVLWQEFSFFTDSAIIRNPFLKYLPLTLSHSARYTECSYVYEEPDPSSAFYPFAPVDDIHTQDELLLHQLNNNFLLSNPGQAFLKYAVGLGHENIEINNGSFQGHYSQISSSFDVRLKLPLRIDVQAYGKRFYGGYNDKDTYSKVTISKKFGNANNPIAGITVWHQLSVASPDWTQQHFHSNLFNWDNSFLPAKTNTLGADLNLWKFVIGYRFHTIEHFIFNNFRISVPVQSDRDIKILQFYAQLKLKIWKIVLDNRLDNQAVNRTDVLKLPKLITRHTLYFDFKLFHGAMILQPGVAMYWQSGYYASAYMPATRSFYIQEDIRLNDQLYADVFINMKVSRARIFLKYQHFNSHFGPYDYYMIPHYPVQDAAIRFGIYWLVWVLPDKDKKFELDAK